MRERRMMSLTQKTTLTINVIILVSIIAAVIGAATWKSDIEHDIQNNTEHIERVEAVQAEILKREVARDLLFAEIRTDLKWIRTDLEKRH